MVKCQSLVINKYKIHKLANLCLLERERASVVQPNSPKKMEPIAFAWRGKEGEIPDSLTVEDLLHL